MVFTVFRRKISSFFHPDVPSVTHMSVLYQYFMMQPTFIHLNVLKYMSNEKLCNNLSKHVIGCISCSVFHGIFKSDSAREPGSLDPRVLKIFPNSDMSLVLMTKLTSFNFFLKLSISRPRGH